MCRSNVPCVRFCYLCFVLFFCLFFFLICDLVWWFLFFFFYILIKINLYHCVCFRFVILGWRVSQTLTMTTRAFWQSMWLRGGTGRQRLCSTPRATQSPVSFLWKIKYIKMQGHFWSLKGQFYTICLQVKHWTLNKKFKFKFKCRWGEYMCNPSKQINLVGDNIIDYMYYCLPLEGNSAGWKDFLEVTLNLLFERIVNKRKVRLKVTSPASFCQHTIVKVLFTLFIPINHLGCVLFFSMIIEVLKR
jgi:hypothetical protein